MDQKEFEALKAQVQKLEKEQAEQGKTLGEVKAQSDKQAKTIEGIGKALKDSKTIGKAEEQKQEVKKLEKAKVPDAPFVVKGKKYKFTVPKFIWKGEEYTAAAAMEDDALLEEIVAKSGADADKQGAGIIQSVK